MDENYAPVYEGLVNVYMKTNQELGAKEYTRSIFLNKKNMIKYF